MSTKSQHKESKKVCPACKKEKVFPDRNNTCSLDCANALRQNKLQETQKQPDFDESVKAILLKAKGFVNLHEISEKLDRSTKTVREALLKLRGDGYNVDIDDSDNVALPQDVKPGTSEPIIHDVKHFDGNWHKFGACGDNHFGSKHERLDVINALYDLYEAEGITTVYNTGNMVEGEMRLNFHDIKVFGLDDQVEYFVENYPERKGITTYFVTGDDHEGWYQRNNRMEIGRYIQNVAEDMGRFDLKYMGYVEADVKLMARDGHSMMKVMHPGGGSAYALSYASQKLVESFQGGEKPKVLLYGHYHKFDYNYAREVHAIGTGCTVDQSIFMRKQKISAHVGGTIVKLNQAPDGTINRLAVEWIPFYDKGFYTNRRNFGLTENKPIIEVIGRKKAA